MLYTFHDSPRGISCLISQKIPWLMPFNSPAHYTKGLHKKDPKISLLSSNTEKHIWFPHCLKLYKLYIKKKSSTNVLETSMYSIIKIWKCSKHHLEINQKPQSEEWSVNLLRGLILFCLLDMPSTCIQLQSCFGESISF